MRPARRGTDANRDSPSASRSDAGSRRSDLRVPHFLGLHALQLLPLIAVALGRGRGDTAVRTVRAAAGSYVALFGILLVQALRGEPLLAPGSVTLALVVTWALLSVAALWASRAWHGHDRSTLAKA